MRFYFCGINPNSQFISHNNDYNNQATGKKPLCFDFKNYRIKWDPRVEEYVNKLRTDESLTRIVGTDHSRDSFLDDDDEPVYYSDNEDSTDTLRKALSLLKIKPTSPLLKRQFDNPTESK
jgi:hypothetical protein